MKRGDYGCGVFENLELRDFAVDNCEEVHMRIVESNAGRFRPHPFCEQHDHVLALSDKSVSFEMFACDNLARPLYKFDECFVPYLFTEEAVYEIVPKENADLGLPMGIAHCFGRLMMRDRLWHCGGRTSSSRTLTGI